MMCPASASPVPPSLAVLRGAQALLVLVLSGAIVWDRVNDGLWPRHALFTSLIVVAVTAPVLNEVLERGSRTGWRSLTGTGTTTHGSTMLGFETAGVVDAIGGELSGSVVGRSHS